MQLRYAKHAGHAGSDLRRLTSFKRCYPKPDAKHGRSERRHFDHRGRASGAALRHDVRPNSRSFLGGNDDVWSRRHASGHNNDERRHFHWGDV